MTKMNKSWKQFKGIPYWSHKRNKSE